MSDEERVAMQRKIAGMIRDAGDGVDPSMQLRLAELFIVNPMALVPWPLALAVAARDPRLRDALAQVLQVEMARVMD